jgi:micrococcal nuclease
MAIVFLVTVATFQRFPDGISIDWRGSATIADLAGTGAVPARDTLSARFGLCDGGGGRNCVVDGDTFWFAGDKYRIADIDTPETHPARCAREAALGQAATDRLHDWLNDGAFSLESIGRDTDRYDRKLRIVTRGGMSVGTVLVAEGLARPWEGQRRPWC